MVNQLVNNGGRGWQLMDLLKDLNTSLECIKLMHSEDKKVWDCKFFIFKQKYYMVDTNDFVNERYFINLPDDIQKLFKLI